MTSVYSYKDSVLQDILHMWMHMAYSGSGTMRLEPHLGSADAIEAPERRTVLESFRPRGVEDSKMDRDTITLILRAALRVSINQR